MEEVSGQLMAKSFFNVRNYVTWYAEGWAEKPYS